MTENGNIFEELPRRIKRRKKTNTPHTTEATIVSNSVIETLVPRHSVTPSIGIGIHALDPTRLSGSQRLGIIGLPGTGKSTCCMSLLNELRYSFPIINVFSGSEADNPYYSLCIPKIFINTNVTRKGLKQFINRQRLALAHDTPLKDALLILDDCFESPQALDNDMMHPWPRVPTYETHATTLTNPVQTRTASSVLCMVHPTICH